MILRADLLGFGQDPSGVLHCENGVPGWTVPTHSFLDGFEDGLSIVHSGSNCRLSKPGSRSSRDRTPSRAGAPPVPCRHSFPCDSPSALTCGRSDSEVIGSCGLEQEGPVIHPEGRAAAAYVSDRCRASDRHPEGPPIGARRPEGLRGRELVPLRDNGIAEHRGWKSPSCLLAAVRGTGFCHGRLPAISLGYHWP